MSHARHRFWKWHKTLTFCLLLAGWRIPCACHAKWRFNVQKWREHVVLCAFWLRNVLRATTAYTFWTSQLPKAPRGWGVLYILASKRASCQNCVPFLNISTSKNGPKLVCFVHFDFEMCFAPQRRALFRHLNFQKWSENGVFCTFWLRNVLRATTACTFSTSQLPNVVRHWGPSGATNQWKNNVSRLSYLFAHLHLLSSRSFSSLIFSLRLFSSLTLPTSAFPSVHIVGRLTSKPPSMKWNDMMWFNMIWFDLVLYNLVWFNMTWYELLWFDIIWYDMIWLNMIWHDLIWYDLIWYDMI